MPEHCRQAPDTFIRKSHFTRLKKICLQARLPRLLPAVTFLEAAAHLLSRGQLRTLLELCRLGWQYGPDYLPHRHLHPDYYRQWLRQHEPPASFSGRRPLAEFPVNPKIALIVAVPPAELPWLPDFLPAVSRQCYPHWELALLATRAALDQLADNPIVHSLKEDARICLREHPNPPQGMNEALSAATGEFVMFPTCRDILAPNALLAVAGLLNRSPEADIIYADADTVDAAGRRSDPFFKPAWSPDLALSMPYTGPATVFRTSRLRDLGGIRPALWPAVPYDLLLRLLDRTPPAKIKHIPQILSHRSVASDKSSSDLAALEQEAAKQALQDHLRRTSLAGTIQPGSRPGTFRLVRELADAPGVSIIIPFKDNVTLLSQCLDSIFRKTGYPRFEIILVDNQSREQATSAYLAGLADNPRVRLLDYPRPFNYSAINNLAAAHASHPYLLFLNNDTQVISADWLRAMVEHIQRPEVGAVGAKLLYPGNTIQHGGLALGGGGRLCGDYFRGSPENQAAHVLTQVIRNCSAVTGACLLTKKNLFQAVGGFDAVNLPICYNDVDLCLKLRDRGYLIVWTPYARLYHHESVSRAHTPPLAELTRLCREQKFFEAKWLAVLEQDPYYNPNLSRLFDGYAY